MNSSRFPFAVILTAFFVAGCATGSSSGTANKPATAAASGSESRTLQKDKDIQGVWLAPGFKFIGYSALLVEPTKYAGVVRDNEVQERALAVREVQSAIISSAKTTGLFSTVAAGSPAGTGKALRMSNTIVKFEKGGGGLRYVAGIYGAGQPHVRVRGEIFDGQKLVCIYEVERSGENGAARMLGAYMTDVRIMTADIGDLATDLAAFFKRTSAK